VLTIGTNIGLGLVLDGRVVRGAHGAAGEVGLLLVPTDDGPATTAGEGRLADAGRFGRVRSAAPAGYAFIEELIGGAALAAASSTGTSAGLSLGDPAVDPIAARAIEGWALVIADLGVVLDLDRVVLTGRVAASAAHLIDRLRTRVAELVALPPEIRLGALGPDAELLGADLLARAALASRDRQDARAGLSAQRRGGDR
jgi:glucokinase